MIFRLLSVREEIPEDPMRSILKVVSYLSLGYIVDIMKNRSV